MFNFWWSARLVDGLESHPPPLSSQKIEMLMFGLRSASDDQPGWSSSTFYNLPHPLPLPYSDSVPEQETGKFQFQMDIYVYIYMDSNPICHPSPAKQNEMLIFGLRSPSDDQPGWSMDLNPTRHPSLAKKVKCSFLDYVQLLMIGWAGRWTRAPSATHLQPKKWNAHFWIAFNFWWLAGLVNGLESCPPPLSSQNNEMHFWITFNFWWLDGLVDGLKAHLPPLSSQKIEMLIFGLRSTSDDQPGWSSSTFYNLPHPLPLSFSDSVPE